MMNSLPQDQDWEERLQTGLGFAPRPDFDTWCAQHTADVTALQTTRSVTMPSETRPELRQLQPNRGFRPMLKWVAALLLIAVGLLCLSPGDSVNSKTFADAIPGVDDVQAMTWTDTYYCRYTSKDGQRSWIATERRLHAYRHPGQYRETMLDQKGEVISIHITDNRAGRMLALDVKAEQAVLKFPTYSRGERAPFAWVGDEIRERANGKSLRVRSLSLQGAKEIDKIRANVLRAKVQSVDNQATFHQDFLFDVASKRLVGIWQPNEADLEFETAVDSTKLAEAEWSKWQPVAVLTHEIVLKPKLDPAEFSLDPPVGYAFEKQAKPTVTEEEMLAFLGAAARFSDNQFPDSPEVAYDRDKYNAASSKELTARTAAEQEMIEIRDKILMREIFKSPIKQFEEDQTLPNSFHYVGSDVKVGQADRIVCWYKPRSSKMYRAVFGDLSVKDVTEAELPLNIAR
jgi:hypothetical protein